MAKKIKIKTKKRTSPKDFDIAVQYYQAGNLQQAEAVCRQILGAQQGHADAWHLLGVISAECGHYSDSIDYISKAINISPGVFFYYYNLGNAYRANGMMKEAMGNYKKALQLKPDFTDALINLGAALKDKGLLDEAIVNFRKALKLAPGDAEVYNNLGNALRDKGLLDEAVENFRKALNLAPGNADIYNNLGVALQDLGMVEEALDNIKKALMLKPDSKTHDNLGRAYLLLKNFEMGWEEHEWRLNNINVAYLSKPKWDGSTLKGRTILVYAEQGYGDTLQFTRYLPKLYEDFDANKVLFIPQKGLEQLLREGDLKAEILDAATDVNDIKYDTNIHLLSLPGIFKTNLENMPFKGKRYLKANPEKVEWYREKFFDPTPYTLHPTPFRIGIFWQGNPSLSPDKNRSMSLQNFYPLCRLPGVKVYSLQKGYGTDQLNDLPDDIEIINLGETFKDFSDTAAAIENLDLMITVDTAIGHLSGGLGKKTWILLPLHTEWRWHLDMDYSPWYEDVRLFRHKEFGKKDWEEMMERVVEEIRAKGIGRRV